MSICKVSGIYSWVFGGFCIELRLPRRWYWCCAKGSVLRGRLSAVWLWRLAFDHCDTFAGETLVRWDFRKEEGITGMITGRRVASLPGIRVFVIGVFICLSEICLSLFLSAGIKGVHNHLAYPSFLIFSFLHFLQISRGGEAAPLVLWLWVCGVLIPPQSPGLWTRSHLVWSLCVLSWGGLVM